MTDPPRTLSCPICKRAMRSDEVEGLTADLCNDHGLWLDKDELRQIVERIKLEEMTKARRVMRTSNLSELAGSSMTQGVLSRWWNRF